jgi:hypothetical protein
MDQAPPGYLFIAKIDRNRLYDFILLQLVMQVNQAMKNKYNLC